MHGCYCFWIGVENINQSCESVYIHIELPDEAFFSFLRQFVAFILVSGIL